MVNAQYRPNTHMSGGKNPMITGIVLYQLANCAVGGLPADPKSAARTDRIEKLPVLSNKILDALCAGFVGNG